MATSTVGAAFSSFSDYDVIIIVCMSVWGASYNIMQVLMQGVSLPSNLVTALSSGEIDDWNVRDLLRLYISKRTELAFWVHQFSLSFIMQPN